ncbi:MAG: integrase family protein [Burkholderiaceae bacterium]|nr:integrase family protein [Burkholderiaceae bacterium]
MPTLTNLRVDRASLPASGQTFVWCSQDHGFGVRLNASGTRTFVVQGRVDGRERRVSIGRRGVFTVDQARDRAREILRSMRMGIDPVAEKEKQAHMAVTLRQAIADYGANKRTKNGALKARTQMDINAHSRKSFADWLDKPVTSITRDACAHRFAEVSKRGPTTANQAFRYLRSILNYARNRHWVDDEPVLRQNPVDVLKYSWHPTKARSERIPFDRIGAVWHMLAAQAHSGCVARGERTAAAFIQFLILTGARLREAGELTWDRLDLDGPQPSWCIRPQQSKTGTGRVFPLSIQAISILCSQPQVADNPYVFTSRNGKSHVVQSSATWRAVSRLAGVRVTAHSMRRTFTNTCLKLGIEMWKTEMLTSHVPTTTTLLHYTDTADLRENCADDVQKVADWIESEAQTAALRTGYPGEP